MSTYVLIHGSWHGAWCWEKVVPLLQKAGHTVVTPDLPGHGDDQTPVSEITLQSYAARVCQVVEAQAEPVILVGHSMGGIAITQAAEFCPDKINTLVYLCAFLLQNGQSLFQVAQTDQGSMVLPNLTPDEAQGVLRLNEAIYKEMFYGDCTEADAAWAISRLRPDPMAPVGTPLTTSPANFGRLPRIYIECLADRTLSPATQKQMYTALPCREVLSINSSHSPFLSQPETLASHLMSLVRPTPVEPVTVV